MLYNYKNLTLTLKLCPRDIILDSSLAASFFSATFKMRNGLMTNPLYQNLLVTSNTLRNWSPCSALMNDGGRKSFWNWTARCNVIWSWNEERCHSLQVCYFSRYIFKIPASFTYSHEKHLLTKDCISFSSKSSAIFKSGR